MDESSDEKLANRLEGVALGQYYAIRAILYAVIAIVGIAIAGFALVLLAIGESAGGWEVHPAVPGAVGLPAAGWFIYALGKSVEAFRVHQAVNRRLLALKPYSTWADSAE